MWLKPSLLWLGLALGLGGMLWSDLDVVLVHSPIEAFRWDRRQALMEWLCEHDQPNMANTGFGYVLGTPEAKDAASRWASMRGFKYSKQHRSYSKYNEQGALWLLNEQHTPRMQLYHCLPKETFLSGCNWKYQAWRLTERHYSALHFSCLDDKVARMRQPNPNPIPNPSPIPNPDPNPSPNPSRNPSPNPNPTLNQGGADASARCVDPHHSLLSPLGADRQRRERAAQRVEQAQQRRDKVRDTLFLQWVQYYSKQRVHTQSPTPGLVA